MTREELGMYGEAQAAALLKQKGFSILHQNWRHRKFELDLVCTHANHIVFVEVKTRDTALFGEPWEFLTRNQQKRLIQAADWYVREHGLDLEVRFDVVSVVHNQHGTRIAHYPEAFYPML